MKPPETTNVAALEAAARSEERRCRRLGRAIVALLLGGTILLAAGAAPMASSRPRAIQARVFGLVDREGNLRGAFRYLAEPNGFVGSRLDLVDANSRARALVWANERVKGSGISLNDRTGTPRVHTHAGAEHAMMSMKDARGMLRAGVGVNVQNRCDFSGSVVWTSMLQIRNAEQKLGCGIMAFANGAGGLVTYDSNQQPVLEHSNE